MYVSIWQIIMTFLWFLSFFVVMRTDEAHQVTASRLEVWEHLKQEFPDINLLKNTIYGALI